MPDAGEGCSLAIRDKSRGSGSGARVSFATVNWWENKQTKPSRLARTQFNLFCEKMVKQGNWLTFK